jgi:FtsP/CotA-like multicopper oxidase with cupredoxin domain
MPPAFQRGYQKIAVVIALFVVVPVMLRPWQVTADPGTAGLREFDPSLLQDRIDPCFNNSPVGKPFAQPMPIPPTANPVPSPDAGTDTYVITEKRGEAEIVPGKITPIWGYEGITPGPTILARKLRPVNVTFVNALPPDEDRTGIIDENPQRQENHPFLPSSTVVHLHGINGDHFSDGYADDGDGNRPHKHRKNPGEAFAHHYPNNQYQRPWTGWYHDHSVHITSHHVYRGLAAFYWLSDPQEDALRLPGSPLADPGRGYGFFDIPLVQKDVMIDPATGLLIYNNCSTAGAYGDVMTVNGKQQPRFDVANRKYRFRHLDASDARQYLIAIRKIENLKRPTSDATANEPFFLIGSDQGLLFSPEITDRFHTSPAERWEFVVDFSKYAIGQRLVMVNLLAREDDEKLFPLMAFDVTRTEADTSQVPPVLRPPEDPADVASAAQVRSFQFERNGGYWAINDQIFDPNRDDARPLINTNEDWTLFNKSGGWGHPVHIHLGRFQVLKVEGRAPRPGELNGFKDVVWVGPNQSITVRHQFWNFNDRFVFHCHNGSHEDNDMMSQFNVQPNL